MYLRVVWDDLLSLCIITDIVPQSSVLLTGAQQDMESMDDQNDNQEKAQSMDENAPSGDESSSSREPGKG